MASIGFLFAIRITGNKAEMMLHPIEMPNKAKTTKKFGFIKENWKAGSFIISLLTKKEITKTRTVERRKFKKAMMNASE